MENLEHREEIINIDSLKKLLMNIRWVLDPTLLWSAQGLASCQGVRLACVRPQAASEQTSHLQGNLSDPLSEGSPNPGRSVFLLFELSSGISQPGLDCPNPKTKVKAGNAERFDGLPWGLTLG